MSAMSSKTRDLSLIYRINKECAYMGFGWIYLIILSVIFTTLLFVLPYNTLKQLQPFYIMWFVALGIHQLTSLILLIVMIIQCWMLSPNFNNRTLYVILSVFTIIFPVLEWIWPIILMFLTNTDIKYINEQYEDNSDKNYYI